MDSYETLLYEERDGVAIVTLNRPDVLNAFNQAMAHEVARRQALDQVSTWVSLGTEYDNIEDGQQAFQNPKNREWRLR
ncbi:MAG: hypothetical protein ABW008_03500 [Acidimicrobiales bacterium]